jgi:transposase
MLIYECVEFRPIIYLDESGFSVDAPREYGYSEKGLRCYWQKDWHARGRVNAIGAIHNFEFITISLFQGNINSDVFYAWVTQDLIPKLPDKAVVVMDNASFHKRKDIQRALEIAGNTIEYLPPYSPELNPIEKKWAQAKAIRKKFRCDPEILFSKFIV